MQPTAEQSANLWGIVFAGGIGSRFWPLSSPSRPKQLLHLVDDRPLIAHTIRRFRPIIPPERVIVMTSRDICAAIHAAIPEVPAANMLAEPSPMGTAASLAWALSEIRRRGGNDAVVCVSHADLAISFLQLFHDSLATAAAAARRTSSIVLLGVAPTRADAAFGYISRGDPASLVGGPAAEAEGAGPSYRQMRAVRAFHEKPSAAEAESLIAEGALWHSGILVAGAAALEAELRAHEPSLNPALDSASGDEFETLADSLPHLSMEAALLERAGSMIVMHTEFSWDDVGTWASLRRARELDDDGNGIVGPAHLFDSTANIVHTEDGTTVLYGVSNMLVVRMSGVTFVTTLDRARDLRPLLDSLPESVRRGLPE